MQPAFSWDDSLHVADDVLATILSATREGLAIVDRSGRLLACNATARGFLGLAQPPTDRTYDDDVTVFYPDEVTPYPLDRLPLTRALRGEESEIELFVRNSAMPEGRHLCCQGVPIRGADTQVRGVVLAFRDLSETRRTSRLLERTHARFAALVASTPNVAIQGYGADGRVRFWNSAAVRMYGWDEGDAVGKPLDELMLDGPSARAFEALLTEIRASGAPAGPFEWTCRRRDGEIVIVYSTLFALPAINDEVEVVCMDVDITALKNAEDRLRAQAARQQTLLHFGERLARARLDLDDLFERAARTVAELRGESCVIRMVSHDGQELVIEAVHHAPGDRGQGRAVFEAHGRHPRLPPTVGPWREAIEGRRPVMAHVEGTAPTGSVVVAPLMGRLGPLGTLELWRPFHRPLEATDAALLMDMAERAALAIDNAQLFARAQQAVRVREDFLSVASHELRTPLTPLEMQLDLLEHEMKQSLPPDGAAPLLRRVGVARRQVDRLEHLVRTLLDVPRVKDGAAPGRRWSDLAQLAREVANRFGREAARAGCRLQLRLDEKVEGPWDPMLLEMAVRNLVGNAIKFGAGAPVELDVHAAAGTAQVTVRDRGIGVARSDQSRIFGRFERAVSGLHYGGLGLGLWIVSEVAAVHGGSIQVVSEPGEGATFTLTLPRNEVRT